MTYDLPHAESYFQPRFRVAGVELLPMQMGHVLLLTAMESPLLYYGDEEQRSEVLESDIALFMFALTRTWDRAAKEIAKGNWLFRRRLMAARKAVKRVGLTHALVEVTKACNFHLREIPESARAETHERESHCPTWGFLTSRFMAWGWSKRQVLDESIRVLRWESICHGDITGNVIIKPAGSNEDEHAKAVKSEILKQAKEALKHASAKKD